VKTIRDMDAFLKKTRKEGAKIAKSNPSSGGYQLITEEEKNVVMMPNARPEQRPLTND